MGDLSRGQRTSVLITLVVVCSGAASAIAVSGHGTFKWAALIPICIVVAVFSAWLFGWPPLPGVERRGPAMVSVPDGVQCRGVPPYRVVCIEVRNDGPHAVFDARGEWVMANDERVGGAAPWPVCITNQADTECSVDTGGHVGLDLAILHVAGLGSWTATPVQPGSPMEQPQHFPALGMDLESTHADLRLRVTIRSSMARDPRSFEVCFVQSGREWLPVAELLDA